MTKRLFADAFNLLCYGDKIGSGSFRDVWQCRLDSKMVVKVERDDTQWRNFHNIHEAKFWSDNEHYEKVSKWLAPVEYVSPDGFILIQRKVEPIPKDYKLPEKLPAFLTDIKPSNFGLLDGKLVCIDYGLNNSNPSLKLTKANWE